MAENAVYELTKCPACGGDDIVVEIDSLSQEFCLCLSCIEMWPKPGVSS